MHDLSDKERFVAIVRAGRDGSGEDNDLNGSINSLFITMVTSVATKFAASGWLNARLTSSTPTRMPLTPNYQHLKPEANLACFLMSLMAVLGGSLKRRERISARLGGYFKQLYLASRSEAYERRRP
ncbi:DUF1974 domain-containing protein [Escherichia coli]|nr:DUF1974 domain-containing protein [Escherichia coli]